MRDSPSQAGDSGSDYYMKFLSSPEYRESRLRKAAVLATIMGDEIRDAAVVGDVGSGTGLLKGELERICGRSILGFEVDPGIPIERRRTCVADGARLPVSDASFDFLILNHVYEHVNEPRKLFAEVLRVLKPGGQAYVTAGSRWAIVEPHYRLPFLSWLPTGLADRYVRGTGRGRDYSGIRFLGYGPLRRTMDVPGLQAADITERAIRSALEWGAGRSWRPLWGLFSRLPAGARKRTLRWGPQWFFLLTRRD